MVVGTWSIEASGGVVARDASPRVAASPDGNDIPGTPNPNTGLSGLTGPSWSGRSVPPALGVTPAGSETGALPLTNWNSASRVSGSENAGPMLTGWTSVGHSVGSEPCARGGVCRALAVVSSGTGPACGDDAADCSAEKTASRLESTPCASRTPMSRRPGRPGAPVVMT